MKFKFYLLYIAVFAICLTISNSSRAQAVNTQDSLVLVDFVKLAYDNNPTVWNPRTPLNTWEGVTVKNNRVSGVRVPFIITSIPVSIGKLDHLSALEIHNSVITVPAGFWKLHNLTLLNLSSCGLRGLLSDSLINLQKLTYLDLHYDYINDDLPASLGKLANLTYLDLSVCSLGGKNISAISHLSHLEHLDLRSNSLTASVLPLIDSLPQLKWLNLERNNLPGTLSQVHWDNFTALHTLLLSYNNFIDTVPYALGHLPLLDTVALQQNSLTGIAQLLNLNQLSVVNVANNYLSFNGTETLAKNFLFATYAPQKTFLPITYNPSSLSISAGGTLSNNTYHWYMNDSLVADITGDSTYPNPLDEHYTVKITNALARNLTLINIDVPFIQDSLALVDLYNKLHGSNWKINNQRNTWNLLFPVKEWSGITVTGGRVTAINLNTRNLTGPALPQSIGALTALKYLDLGNNYIGGDFPQTFANLRKLETLAIKFGTFKSFPALICRLGKLTYLNLYSAIDSSGSIPAGIDSLANLEYLDLTGDRLRGELPSSIGSLTKLAYLALDGNRFSNHTIPESFSNLANLQTLRMEQDSLAGNIPAFIAGMPKLSGIWLGFNNFTGSIPASFAKHFHTLMMGFNNISGSIPDGLAADSLDLSKNLLTDTIPASVGQNENGVSLVNLSYNQLTGHIPASLGSASPWQLSLSNNKLTGTIPGTFNHPIDGVYDFTYNDLSGKLPPLEKVLNSGIGGANFLLAYNKFNFSGLINGLSINPQKNLPIYKQSNTLYMMAGDTLANDTFRLFKNGVLVQAHLGDSAFVITTTGSYNITAKNKRLGGFTLYTDTLLITGDSLILPASPNTLYANAEYTDTAGWTNYYYNNNTPNDITDDTLLLSIKKNGQNIGTIGDGTFNVKLAATDGAGSNTGIFLSSPLITNTSGYWVMNRYWHVTPTTQPSTPVGVRFYYNNQDVADVNGSYPAHDLHKDSLLFYKAIGGDPDPTTGLSGATDIISILPGSTATTTTYTYHAISDTTQYAEYMVSSFSGGGGGGTGNKQALPVTLLNFTAKNYFKINHLSWQTTQEVNSAYFEVQKSTDNSTYTSIGTVTAQGNSSITSSYNFDDVNPASGNNYYRLKIVDKDAQYSYSKVVLVKNNGGTGISLYPNPAKTTVQISFANIQAGRYSVTVCTTGGKIVAAKTYTLGTGSQTISLPVNQYANGIYIVKITDSKGQVISTEKVVKQ